METFLCLTAQDLPKQIGWKPELEDTPRECGTRNKVATWLGTTSKTFEIYIQTSIIPKIDSKIVRPLYQLNELFIQVIKYKLINISIWAQLKFD